MQHTINLLNNDSFRLKSRLDERDDLIHEKGQNVIYLESEVKKLKYEQDKIQKVTDTSDRKLTTDKFSKMKVISCVLIERSKKLTS